MAESILLVEDDNDIADIVTLYLRQDGFEVTVAPTGEEALGLLRGRRWDLLLLDLNLPGIDGFKVLEELRRETDTPVIIVTARVDETDAVYGLRSGADEYVTKPFSPKVLVARVRALLRRSRKAPAEGGEVHRFGAYTLDVEACRLRRDQEQVSLAPREFDLLVYLVRRAGSPRTPAEIYDDVWNKEYGDVASVAVHIQRLRKKIEADPAEPRYIQTLHGYGYYFSKEELLK